METKEKILIGIALSCVFSVFLYYVMEVGPRSQRDERIKPLLENGLTREEAIQFDKYMADQDFRWPWEENPPYHGLEIKLARMWRRSPVTVGTLIHKYYLQGAKYHALIWLLKYPSPQPRFRTYSYWENVVNKAIYGDANGDGVSNYESILGEHAQVLHTLSPNPVAIYALEKGLPENLVKRLKIFESDLKMASWEKEVVDRVAENKLKNARLNWILENFEANPATIHALLRENLTAKWIEKIKPLGKDGLLKDWERHLIGHVKEIPPICLEWASQNQALKKNEKYLAYRFDELPPLFLENILSDGSISYEDWMQAKFLTGFSGKDLEDKSAEWICDPDLDNDGFTNEFENNSLFTDPYVHNQRKALVLYDNEYFEPTHRKNRLKAMVHFLEGKNKSERNRWSLEKAPTPGFGEVTTRTVGKINYHNIIENLSQNTDSDDVILFVFVGHGERNSPLKGLSYREIDNGLDKLKSNLKILIIDSCYSGNAIQDLGSENRLILTSSGENELAYGWFYYLFFSSMREKASDLNGNGYCSVLESFNRARKLVENRFGNHPKMSAKYKGENAYLVELYLGWKDEFR
ncbi:hypothetical protein AKJ41_05785 [candidate division MSBL1 archaeon SCGC-AAA259O05]|uniref:Uncharacterized protein n=1 Tax=candidate division MSBL1 archaeon SCGC-AAA259O05 TaxID=1698271 RepID=A0A133UYD0_9EURY|nr:hypothetical protein AKJ41_05785 [candidate division MSBL1 archaeon SCGC-AAA259O05]